MPKHINKPDYAKDGTSEWHSTHCPFVPDKSTKGVPKSEALEPYNSIRIFNKKQQERMRVVCKVLLISLVTTIYADWV